MIDKRAAKREYLETPPPAGIFQVRNLSNDRVFIGSSINLDGIFNRYRMQLAAGLHFCRPLQVDWSKLGADSFVFEVLEILEPRSGLDMRRELEALEDLWLEKEAPYGERGYNEPKKTREERLRMIAAKRNVY